MPVELNIRADFEAAKALYGPKGQRKVIRAARRALNETAHKVKVRAADVIHDKLPVMRKTVNRALSVRKARNSDLHALVIAVGEARIPIIQLKPKPRQIKKGVSYKLDGDRRLIKGAFKQKVKGHTGIFKRRREWKHKKMESGKWHGLPISEITAPGIPSKFSSKAIEQSMLKHAANQWPRSFKRLIKLEFPD